MSKKKDSLDDFSELASSTGGELLSNSKPVKYWIDTGSLAVNYICSGKFYGGGIPSGKIVEMYGPPSSGKSLWGTNILRGTQAINGIPIYLDCENALEKGFAERASHVNTSKIIRYAPRSLETVFSKIYNVIRAVREKYGNEKPLVFVYDSITVSPCERELREIDLPEGQVSEADWRRIVGNKEMPGERAKVCNREFRKLESLLETSNTTLFVINQIRYKIGVLFGNNETTGGGGAALEFYAGCRLRTKVMKNISNERKLPIGVNLGIRNVKNRCFSPFRSTEGINLYFEKGINPISGLLNCLLMDGRIEGTLGHYKVCEPYCNGKEIKFRASLAKGLVPLDVLYDCPNLIDAPDADTLKDYFSVFYEAINETNCDKNIELAVGESEEEG